MLSFNIEVNVNTISDYKVEEAIRRLSVNLSNSYPDAHTIMVSSVAGKEGKSFVSIQLARILAGRGMKTVYVNADLRLGGNEAVGLSEYMEEEVKKEQIIADTDCKNLSTILPGKKSGTIINELLMEKLLKELREEYEYVIVDTSSLGEVADGIVIGKFCDGVLLVMEPEIVEENKAKNVKAELERSGCKILGIVLNKEMK